MSDEDFPYMRASRRAISGVQRALQERAFVAIDVVRQELPAWRRAPVGVSQEAMCS
jgi:hypothetical protein